MTAFLSRATVAVVGLTCKAALNIGLYSVTVHGFHHLRSALSDVRRNDGHGVMTVSNHISTLDDPLVWGTLPISYYFSKSKTRWALGASDIMFTNPLFSAFFRLGQTLETFRGKGVHQPAVDTAIHRLDHGDWVHLYSEGKVNQPNTYTPDHTGVVHLPRFKWGVGRILMETAKLPVIIPMWLTGFDKLMPEGRGFPYKYLPRPGADLSVTFGTPMGSEKILDVLLAHSSIEESAILKKRAAITAVIQQEVESLGRSVCGDTLKR